MPVKTKEKKKTVLITGATGLLGMELLRKRPETFTIVPTSLHGGLFGHNIAIHKIDITDSLRLDNLFSRFKPNIVIHTASIGNVDYCEYNRKEAYRANVEGTKNVLEVCKKYGAAIIFTSSNAVFDGKQAPYDERAKVNPVNYYGYTKVKAENIIQESGLEYVIARLVLMYGWNRLQQRDNAVTWLLKMLKKGEDINIVNDTYTNPLLNTQAAEAIWKIVQLKKRGVYHIAGANRINRYEFALETANVFGYKEHLIKPVTSDCFEGIAERMPDTTYITERMQNELSVDPLTTMEGLQYMKKHSLFK